MSAKKLTSGQAGPTYIGFYLLNPRRAPIGANRVDFAVRGFTASINYGATETLTRTQRGALIDNALRTGRVDMVSDALSRAASAVKAIREGQALGAEMDAGFDAGEFSGPAHSDMEQVETRAAVARFGFSPAEFNRELAARTTPRFAHFSNLQVREGGDQ